jgi:anthranilate phosphoribosyltransferase
MQNLIAHVRAGGHLTPEQIGHAVAHLTAAEWEDGVKAELLRALRDKGETVEEIAAFARALLSLAVDPGLDVARLPGPVIDVCGTGGDRMELFNVSTTSMFILAAGGAVVVKHGNRAITSKCGGADVLEKLGVKIDLAPEPLRRCVESLGLGFIFAPIYHPAFKAISPVRKLLAAQGIPTVFNLLGPLLNPARPPFQLVGIFDRTLLPKYAETLRALGRERAWAVHGDGMDELATTGPSEIYDVSSSGVRCFEVTASDLGIAPAWLEDLRGGDCASNAEILVGILDGSIRGPQRDIVVLNAAAGFVVSGICPDLPSGLALAEEQLDSGTALAKLHALQNFRA